MVFFVSKSDYRLTVCSKRKKSVSTPFKVSIIRIRFPNYAILEALFSVDESMGDVIAYIAELLGYSSDSFVLNEAAGNRFDHNSTETLGELRMVPFASLHFKFNDGSEVSFSMILLHS